MPGSFIEPTGGGIESPFSLRLSFEERTILENAAGDMPLGTYIRKQVLEGCPQNGPGGASQGTYKPRKRRQRRRPVKDQKALGQLLGALGESRLSNNLNQLAKAVHTGSLPVTPETEKEIRQACHEIKWMRDVLVKALGMKLE